MCGPGCFDSWSRLLALAGARPDDAGLSRRGFLAAAALVDHGYRPEEAAKILGGNAQRVFRRVGASAAPRLGG